MQIWGSHLYSLGLKFLTCKKQSKTKQNSLNELSLRTPAGSSLLCMEASFSPILNRLPPTGTDSLSLSLTSQIYIILMLSEVYIEQTLRQPCDF